MGTIRMQDRAKLRQAVDNLTERETKQLLSYMMGQINEAVSNRDKKDEVWSRLIGIHDRLLLPNEKVNWEPDAAAETVHIAFGDSFAGSLKFVIKRLNLAETNKVVVFRDLFSVGPLWMLHEEAGQSNRRQWFRDNINGGGNDDEDEEADCGRKLAELFARIPSQAAIVIWSAANAHEQAGLRYAVYLLKDHSNAVFVFDPANSVQNRFNTPDRFIEYLHSGEIPPDKLQAVFGEWMQTVPLPPETRRSFTEEWLSLASRQDVLRIWDGERIRNVEEHYFDGYLLETIDQLHASKGTDEFIKAARVIGQAIGCCDQYVGDGYFEFRLRELIYKGRLEIKGVPRAMRSYSVRRYRNQ